MPWSALFWIALGFGVFVAVPLWIAKVIHWGNPSREEDEPWF